MTNGPFTSVAVWTLVGLSPEAVGRVGWEGGRVAAAAFGIAWLSKIIW